MATFNDLPLEILEYIVNLSVEDAIVLREERTRRKILRNLALVSKEFARPSQAALWKYLCSSEVYFYSYGFVEMIEEGFARKMVGVHYVKALKLTTMCITHSTVTPRMFYIPSVQALKLLEVKYYILPDSSLRLPSSLTTFSWDPSLSSSIYSTFNAIRASPSTIHNFTLSAVPYEESLQVEFTIGIEELFQLRGSALRVLEFGFFDFQLLSLLLPFTPNLRSLKIQNHQSHQNRNTLHPDLTNIIDLLTYLPLSTPLHTLDISSFNLNLISSEDVLLPLLELPQLIQLHKLYCHCTTPITGLQFRPKSIGVNKVNAKREGSEKLEKLIEFCKGRGVQLFLRSENDEMIHRIKELRQMKVIKH